MRTKQDFHKLTLQMCRVIKFVIPCLLLILALFSATLMQATDFAVSTTVIAVGLFVLMHHIELVTQESRNLSIRELFWQILVVLPCIFITISVAHRAAYSYVTGYTPRGITSVLTGIPTWLILSGLVLALIVGLGISLVWQRTHALGGR
jgi:hypothetical protein